MQYISVIFGFCCNKLFILFSFIIYLINIPFEWITKQFGNKKDKISINSTSDTVSSERIPFKQKKNKKNRGGIHRLHHLEKDEDRNKYWNGNSTMFGGDDKGSGK